MHGCRSRQVLVLAALVLAARPAAAAPPAAAYYPGPGDAWERRAPEAVGMDGGRVKEAAAFDGVKAFLEAELKKKGY